MLVKRFQAGCATSTSIYGHNNLFHCNFTHFKVQGHIFDIYKAEDMFFCWAHKASSCSGSSSLLPVKSVAVTLLYFSTTASKSLVISSTEQIIRRQCCSMASRETNRLCISSSKRNCTTIPCFKRFCRLPSIKVSTSSSFQMMIAFEMSIMKVLKRSCDSFVTTLANLLMKCQLSSLTCRFGNSKKNKIL